MSVDLTPLGEAGAWLSAAKVLGPFLERILGPAASEIGGAISDPIARWREGLSARRATRLAAIASRAAHQINAAGIDPTQIPDYIALPLIEKATLVDDEGLQEMWASLMANASNPKTAADISVLFPTMLANLTPRQAKFLSVIFDYSVYSIFVKIHPIASSVIAGHSRMDDRQLMNVVANSSFHWLSDEEKTSTLDNLVSQGIMRRDHEIPEQHYPRLVNKLFEVAGLKKPLHFSGDQIPRVEDFHQLTIAGAQFVIACRPSNQRP